MLTDSIAAFSRDRAREKWLRSHDSIAVNLFNAEIAEDAENFSAFPVLSASSASKKSVSESYDQHDGL
jgi:hypothetical protein